MLRLSKRTEYGLMAVQFMAGQPAGSALSVAEISNSCRIPEGLLSKILQVLRKEGLVSATRGPGGGYQLDRSPSEVSFLQFVNIFEERVSVVECATGGASGCAQFHVCDLRSPLLALNDKLSGWLEQLTLDDVFEPQASNIHPASEVLPQ